MHISQPGQGFVFENVAVPRLWHKDLAKRKQLCTGQVGDLKLGAVVSIVMLNAWKVGKMAVEKVAS